MSAGGPALRLGLFGAAGTLAGILVSGPLALWLIAATRPQPPWAGPAAFTRSFHWVQTLPYAGGLLLVGSLLLLVTSLHALAPAPRRPAATLALLLTAVFASLVCLNYVVQTTFIPALAARATAADGPLLSALTMSNPTSLAWGLEMWGYALLGLATWLLAPVFEGGRVERAASLGFAANGPVSLAGALWTALDPGWEQSPAGLVAFAGWNLLLAVMAALALAALRRPALRRRALGHPFPA